MKIGLEVEFFVTNENNQLIIAREIGGVPTDEYPILAEARGLPFECVFQAVGSVRAEIERMVSFIKSANYNPLFVDWFKKDKQVEVLHDKILRAGLNKHIAYQNLDNRPASKKNKSHIAAGLHVSFTSERQFEYNNENKQSQTFKYNEPFDFVSIFRKIEREFVDEIKYSYRVPGFYEFKSDGRIEYRSLPATLIHKPNFAERLRNCMR